MNSRASFHIVYDGPALATHEMDVRDLAPALIAVSDLLEGANEALNDGKTKVAVNVNASFERGSFGVDLTVVQSGIQSLATFMSSEHVVAAKELLEWIGILSGNCYGLFKFVQWVRGRRVRRVEPVRDGVVRIYIGDDTLEIPVAVLKLFQDLKTREALEAAVTKPLEREGVETFGVRGDDEQSEVFVVSKGDAPHFRVPPQQDTELGETEREMNLQLRSVNFKEGNKWLVYDGASEFFVNIADQGFIAQVNEHQLAFSKHDILVARVLERQLQTSKGLKTERTVLKVVNHIPASRQIQLPYDEE